MSRLRAIVIGVGGGVALAAGLTATMDARGVTCCDPWGVPGAIAFIEAGTMVVEAITASVAEVMNVVETGPLYTWDMGVGKATTEYAKQTASNRVIEQGAVQSATQIYLEGQRAQATEAAVEPAMLDETVPNALMIAEGQPARAQSVRKYDAALADSLVAGPYSNPNALVDRHLSLYCDYRHTANGVCEKQANDDMQNADVSIATIYGGTSATLSDQQRDAALAAVQMIVASDPVRTVSTGAQKSSQEQALEAISLADQATLALAGHVLNAQIADRSRKRESQ